MIKKNFFLALAILILSTLSNDVMAGHMSGGEISWSCDTSGKYIFTLAVNRRCDGVTYNYTNKTLSVYGTPLPRNANNNAITSITLKPDSNRWALYNNGVMPPQCGNPSNQFSCANGDPLLQLYYFVSDPIELNGTPGSSGWRFSMELLCCRPLVTNLNSSGSVLLSSTMYATNNANPCMDNSPQFVAHPENFFCRGVENSIDYSAVDNDGDSIVYTLSPSLNGPGFSPTPVQYATAYSATNPTPDASFNAQNQPAQLDASTGLLQFAAYNTSAQGIYQITVTASSYRNGFKNAEIRRDYPINIVNCPTSSGATNQPPLIASLNNQTYSDSVIVGNLMTIPLIVSDTDRFGGNSQTINVEISGSNLATDYAFQGPCRSPSDSVCAYITSLASTKVYDSTRRNYEYVSVRSFSGFLRWVTDCSDLGLNNTPKTHYFTVRAQDDYCPIPAVNIKTFSITVLPDPNNPCNLATDLSVNENEPDFKLFPNPTSGNVSIHFKDAKRYQIRVRDIQGRVIQSMNTANKSQIDFQMKGAPGLYFIELLSQEGKRTFKKILKR